jgi:hypothetical protein
MTRVRQTRLPDTQPVVGIVNGVNDFRDIGNQKPSARVGAAGIANAGMEVATMDPGQLRCSFRWVVTRLVPDLAKSAERSSVSVVAVKWTWKRKLTFCQAFTLQCLWGE